MRRTIYVVLFMLGTSAVAMGQEQSLNVQDMLARLKSPTNITAELARKQTEKLEDANCPFELGKEISFRIILTNTSMHPIVVIMSNPYFQNRPTLRKYGEEIPYRDEKLSHQTRDDEVDRFLRGNYPIRLDPSVPTQVGKLDLADWFPKLEPGRYELTNRLRFVPDGEWLESPPITFEIRGEERRK